MRRQSAWIGSAWMLALAAQGCATGAAVETDSTLPLRRVVVYRNGVGYFERHGHVEADQVQFRVLQSEVGDFLATLAVMEHGGSSVRSAAFPMPEEEPDPPAVDPAAASSGSASSTPASSRPRNPRRTVRLALDGREHDLVVGYTVETPIWRPSYRLVFNENHTAQVQAWGIVQNLSGEDWRDVRLSLVAGTPVSFRSELAQAVIPSRPVVTDRGAVIDSVPVSDTTLAEESRNAPAPPPPPMATPASEAAYDAFASGEAIADARQGGAGRTRMPRTTTAMPRAPMGGASGYGIAPTPAPPPMAQTTAPRNLASLAALAVQGGSTRYDLPSTVTIPDRSATMVMLSSQDVPGEQMYLFAPDPGVGDSASHPFHVARFENRTGALLERGPLAIFEAGAFLGQGMMEALPDAATTTIPFALERAVAVESSNTWTTEGARLVRIAREQVTIERFNVSRTTYRLRNGMDHTVRVLLRHALNGAELFQPPQGTETSGANALVPVEVPTHGHQEQVVTARAPYATVTSWADEQAVAAIEAYLHDQNPPDAVAAPLRAALDLQRQINERARDRAAQQERENDLQRTTEETRQNLLAIQRNALAQDLRNQLTARLARTATELDQITRRVVELDTQISERRVRFAETVRGIDLDTTRTPPAATPTPAAPAAPAAHP